MSVLVARFQFGRPRWLRPLLSRVVPGRLGTLPFVTVHVGFSQQMSQRVTVSPDTLSGPRAGERIAKSDADRIAGTRHGPPRRVGARLDQRADREQTASTHRLFTVQSASTRHVTAVRLWSVCRLSVCFRARKNSSSPQRRRYRAWAADAAQAALLQRARQESNVPLPLPQADQPQHQRRMMTTLVLRPEVDPCPRVPPRDIPTSAAESRSSRPGPGSDVPAERETAGTRTRRRPHPPPGVTPPATPAGVPSRATVRSPVRAQPVVPGGRPVPSVPRHGEEHLGADLSRPAISSPCSQQGGWGKSDH